MPVLLDTESRARLIFTGVSFIGAAGEGAGMAARGGGVGDIVVCGPAAGSAGFCRSALGRDRVSPVKRSRPSALLHTMIGMERSWQRMHPHESGQATRAAHAISLLLGFAEATVFFVVPDVWISRRALEAWPERKRCVEGKG